MDFGQAFQLEPDTHKRGEREGRTMKLLISQISSFPIPGRGRARLCLTTFKKDGDGCKKGGERETHAIIIPAALDPINLHISNAVLSSFKHGEILGKRHKRDVGLCSKVRPRLREFFAGKLRQKW